MGNALQNCREWAKREGLWHQGYQCAFFLDSNGTSPILRTLVRGMKVFEFQWDEVGEKGLKATWSDDAAHFDELLALADSGVCRFMVPVRADIQASLLAGLVDVTGRVSTSITLACSRCLEGYRLNIDTPFQLTFTRETADAIADVDAGEEVEEEIELSTEELGLIPVEGDVVRLRSLIAEQIILEIPARGLCSDGCRGLCPHCGRNLNDEECGCREPVFDTRFAALAKLKVDSEPEK